MTEDQLAEVLGEITATQNLMIACLLEANGWDAEELSRMKDTEIKRMRFRAEAVDGLVDPQKVQTAAIRATEKLFSKAAAVLAQMED